MMHFLRGVAGLSAGSVYLHTSILHSELATTFVEAAPAPEAWLDKEVVHLLTDPESYHWKHWAATCFATGMVASSAFEGLSSVEQSEYQFLYKRVSRVPVIVEHARLVFVSFMIKQDSSAAILDVCLMDVLSNVAKTFFTSCMQVHCSFLFSGMIRFLMQELLVLAGLSRSGLEDDGWRIFFLATTALFLFSEQISWHEQIF